MRKKYVISVIIGAACLYLAFRKVEWGQMAAAFQSADYRLLPLFVAIHIIGVFIRSLRWRWILEPVKRAGLRNLFSAVSIGFMSNLIFPARAGEFIRAYVIGRHEDISKSSSFATIVIERLFDGFAILFFLALVPLFLVVPPGKEAVMEGIKLAGVLAFVFYVMVIVFLIVLRQRPGLFARVTDLVCRPLPDRFSLKVKNLVSSFGSGLDMLGNARKILEVMACSLFLWTILGMGNWIILKAFGLNLPLFAGFFLLVVQSFGVMVPSPGYVGAFQYAHVLGLSLFGTGKEVSLSLSVILHGLIFLTYVVLGVSFLWAEGLRIGDVRLREAE